MRAAIVKTIAITAAAEAAVESVAEAAAGAQVVAKVQGRPGGRVLMHKNYTMMDNCKSSKKRTVGLPKHKFYCNHSE